MKGFLAYLRLRREVASLRRRVVELEGRNYMQSQTVVRLLGENCDLRALLVTEAGR